MYHCPAHANLARGEAVIHVQGVSQKGAEERTMALLEKVGMADKRDN
nr:hypothetical protein [Halomonas sp.]